MVPKSGSLELPMTCFRPSALMKYQESVPRRYIGYLLPITFCQVKQIGPLNWIPLWVARAEVASMVYDPTMWPFSSATSLNVRVEASASSTIGAITEGLRDPAILTGPTMFAPSTVPSTISRSGASFEDISLDRPDNFDKAEGEEGDPDRPPECEPAEGEGEEGDPDRPPE